MTTGSSRPATVAFFFDVVVLGMIYSVDGWDGGGRRMPPFVPTIATEKCKRGKEGATTSESLREHPRWMYL